ncbi:hypothetical protein N7468_000229 [Penicillium chermesinum]|uniref:Mid2 domain-containing protein n=1 Tax=Penicillium chermesinum TaxID=63820 RepID=A0A9W9TY57_9EURO|nr:uncharacterized protein N7468_000229 [Penicillium chermesinum]KAJ5248778.1 hypothetical protein N7468_000229 [Penicillium chermesinum]KAJ6150882.1 hypothetical protein N7470_007476 [Penicillium chermesinum]
MKRPLEIRMIPLFLAFHALIPPALSVVCYNPDGTSSAPGDTEYGYCPYSNGGVQMCCALNRANPSGGNFSDGNTADKCLPNGLCMNIGINGGSANITTYFRDLCSQTDWDSGCLDVCTDTSKHGISNGTIRMTPCDGTKTSTYWCCGDSDDCCGTADQVKIDPTFASSTAATTSLSATSTSTSTSDQPIFISSGLSVGAKAGIGVGVGVGVIVVAILVIALVMRRRKRNAPLPAPEYSNLGLSLAPKSPGKNGPSMAQTSSDQPSHEGYDTTSYSGTGRDGVVVEADAVSTTRFEMPG